MIHRSCIAISLAAFVLFATASAARGDDKSGFLDRVHKDSDGGEHKYVVFVPHSYTAEKAAKSPFPTILFLHGAGERGTDGKRQLQAGLGKAIKASEKDFQFIAIFPQCERSWQAGSPDADRALAILAEVEKEFRVDADRIYLTGLSLGGMGTWSIGMKHPDRFAALVPICGRGDTKQADKIAKLPIWCFHGDADQAVKVEGSRTMIAAVKEAGGNPKYTEYPGVDHNSWDRAYGTDELYMWLLEQKRAKKE